MGSTMQNPAPQIKNTEMEHQHHPEMPAKKATTHHSKMNPGTQLCTTEDVEKVLQAIKSDK